MNILTNRSNIWRLLTSAVYCSFIHRTNMWCRQIQIHIFIIRRLRIEQKKRQLLIVFEWRLLMNQINFIWSFFRRPAHLIPSHSSWIHFTWIIRIENGVMDAINVNINNNNTIIITATRLTSPSRTTLSAIKWTHRNSIFEQLIIITNL